MTDTHNRKAEVDDIGAIYNICRLTAAAFYKHLGFSDISRAGRVIYGIRLGS